MTASDAPLRGSDDEASLVPTPDGTTRFACLLGRGIGHSRSPQLHSQWFAAAKLKALYLALECVDASHCLALASALQQSPSFLGANITIPFKEDILKLPGVEYSPRVKRLGAANTLFRLTEGTSQKWALENTDVDGVLATLREFPLLNGTNFLILGAGGAAAGALGALLERGVDVGSVVVASRTREKALALALRFPELSVDGLGFHDGSWEESMRLLGTRFKTGCVVINTLPLGLHGTENKWAEASLDLLKAVSGELSYFDMIYQETRSLERCRGLGIPCRNGSLMLEVQARKAFDVWTRSHSLNPHQKTSSE